MPEWEECLKDTLLLNIFLFQTGVRERYGGLTMALGQNSTG